MDKKSLMRRRGELLQQTCDLLAASSTHKPTFMSDPVTQLAKELKELKEFIHMIGRKGKNKDGYVKRAGGSLLTRTNWLFRSLDTKMVASPFMVGEKCVQISHPKYGVLSHTPKGGEL